MSSRVSYALAVALLLLAFGLRVWQLGTLPPGFHDEEIRDLRITETIRAGRVEVFYDLGDEGREGLYHMLMAATTSLTGGGLIGYRILSVWIGMLSLALVYALGVRLFSPLAGLAALALLVVGMWPIVLARGIERETLLPAFISATVLALAYAFSISQRRIRHNPTTAGFSALGILLGLGFYVHPDAFLVVLVSMAFIAYRVIRKAVSRRILSFISFAILVMLIIATPYLISSIRLPELGGAGRLLQHYFPLAKPPLQAIGDSLSGIMVVGDADPSRNLPKRPLVDLVSGLLIAIGLVITIRYWRQPRFLLPLTFFVALVPIAFLATDSPNFLAFSPILPLMALFFGIGVSTAYNSLPKTTRPVMALGLIGLLVFNIVWMTRDLFHGWPQTPDTQRVYLSRLGQLAHHIDLTAADTPTIICTRNLHEPNAPRPQLSPVEIITTFMMHRRSAPLRYADCGTGMIMANGGEHQQVILPDENMLETIHPYIHDWLLTGEPLAAMPTDSVIIMNVAQPLADTIGLFTTTAPVSYAPEATGGEKVVFPPVSFGGNITFLGYIPESSTYPPGGDVPIITYWRVDGIVPPDLRLFAHVLSDPSAIVAQTDTISVKADTLQDRDVFIQIIFVALPNSTPPGTYSISMGAYQDRSDMRLDVLDNLQPRGTRLFLNTINVAPTGTG